MDIHAVMIVLLVLKTRKALTNVFPDGDLFRDGICYNNDFTGLRLKPTSVTSKYPYSDILICFHEEGKDAPLYAKHTIYGLNVSEECNIDEFNTTRWEWNPGSFFPSPGTKPYDVDECFEEEFQNKTMLLALDKQQTEFLVQGQLIPVCDIRYSSLERNVTFHYVNVVPIYKSLLFGNWKRMEQEIRRFTSRTNLNLTIFTGGFGELVLQNSKNQYVILSIGRDKYDNLLHQLPVPRLIWKVLYDEASHSGHALILINNPHYDPRELKEASSDVSGAFATNLKDYIICKDICNQIKWLSWNTTENITAGYIYCCDIETFGSVVHYIHQFIKDHDTIGLNLGKAQSGGNRISMGLAGNGLVIIFLVTISGLMARYIE